VLSTETTIITPKNSLSDKNIEINSINYMTNVKIKGSLKLNNISNCISYFFNVISYEIINSFSQQDKERYFKMVTDHEKLITNLYGNSMLNSVVFLPVALRKGVNNQLIQEYKTWLDKQ
jgi:hypothetical protein